MAASGLTRSEYARERAADAEYAPDMSIVSGKVIDGKVVVEGVSLDEGSTVTVVARDDDETFDVSDEEAAELLESIAQADRGDVVPAAKVLDRLRRRE